MNRHQDQAGIQYGDVAEQAEGIVVPSREQQGRKKATQHAEDRHDHRVEADGEEEGRGRDQHHQQKRGDQPKELEMVYPPAGEGDRVKHHHPGAAQRMRQHRIVLSGQHHAAHQQTEPGDKTNRHAHLGRDEVIVE